MQAESLLFIWTIIELNLVGFILLGGVSGAPGELLLSYFLIQSVGSAGVLFRVLSKELRGSASIGGVLLISLALKLGAAPLHSWFVRVIEKRPWRVLVLLSFPQKILPLLAIRGAIIPVSFLVVLAVLISVVGRMGRLSLKTLLSYSSIFGIG